MNQSPEFEQIIQFIIEVEKLKQVNRMTKVVGTERFENSAEHSWQVALLAMSLSDYADKKISMTRVVQMLLLHDVVEIDTGDKFAYATNHEDTENETEAAKRIFALLPQQIGDKYLTLWLEYEHKSSDDAVFAYAVDRLMPVLLNLHNQGQSWRENGITLAQVIAKNCAVEKASKALWQHILAKLEQAERDGWFN